MKTENTNLIPERIRVSSAQAKAKEHLLRLKAQEATQELKNLKQPTQLEVLKALSALNKLPEFRYGRPVNYQKSGELKFFQDLIEGFEIALRPEKKLTNDSKIPQVHFATAVDDFFKKAEAMVAQVVFTATPEEQEEINNIEDDAYLFGRWPETVWGKNPLDLDKGKLYDAIDKAMTAKDEDPDVKIGNPLVLAKLARHYLPDLPAEQAFLEALGLSPLSEEDIQKTRAAEAFINRELDLDEELRPASSMRTFEKTRAKLSEGLELTSKADFGQEDLDLLHDLAIDLKRQFRSNGFNALNKAHLSRLRNFSEALSTSFANLEPFNDFPVFQELSEFSQKYKKDLEAAYKLELVVKKRSFMRSIARTWEDFKVLSEEIQKLNPSVLTEQIGHKAILTLLDQSLQSLEKLCVLSDTSLPSLSRDLVTNPYQVAKKMIKALKEPLENFDFVSGYLDAIPSVIQKHIDSSKQILWKDPQSVVSYLELFNPADPISVNELNQFVISNLENFSRYEDTLQASLKYLFNALNVNSADSRPKTAFRGVKALLAAKSESYPLSKKDT